jgi:DNA-binding transcriptional LysR family regulator
MTVNNKTPAASGKGTQTGALKIPIAGSTLSTLLTLVHQGLGATILPRMLLDYINDENITAVTLLKPTPTQDICIIYRKDKFMGQAAKLFIKELQAFIQRVKDQTVRSLG